MYGHLHLFHRVDHGIAIVRCKGVYRQVDVYQREQRLYVRQGSGYVKLRGQGRTSLPDLFVEGVELPHGCFIEERPAVGEVVIRLDT